MQFLLCKKILATIYERLAAFGYHKYSKDIMSYFLCVLV